MTLEELQILKEPDIYKYIKIYRDFNSKELALKISKNSMLPARAIAEQASCYQKAKYKLPTLYNNMLFDKIALEQASSEATAHYKSTLVSGTSIIDLTGGLGIDELFFVNSFNKVIYCELNKVICEIFKHNISQLNRLNIEVNNTESIGFLKKQNNNSFDWIYIDPARRDKNRRSVDLEYCSPNIYKNLSLFFKKAQNIMIKAAPAYDLTEAVRQFPNLTEIHVVSVDGECKEVLLLLNRNIVTNNPKIKSTSKIKDYINPRFQSGENELITQTLKRTSICLGTLQRDVDIVSVKLNSKNGKKFILNGKYSKESNREISELKSYFYEPDCSIIKSKLIPLLAKKYNLSFINKLSPYLTNSELVPYFPGRSFRILDFMEFKEKLITRYLNENKIVKANISKRDFRLTVNEIRTRFKLKDGGDYYLFFTRINNQKSIMIVCKK